MKYITYIILLIISGCSTLEYSVSIPVTQHNQNIGNINIQNQQININYKQQNFLQLKSRQN